MKPQCDLLFNISMAAALLHVMYVQSCTSYLPQLRALFYLSISVSAAAGKCAALAVLGLLVLLCNMQLLVRFLNRSR
jgi:hypothetical protein